MLVPIIDPHGGASWTRASGRRWLIDTVDNHIFQAYNI